MELELMNVKKGFQGEYYRETYKYLYKDFIITILVFSHEINSIIIKDKTEMMRVVLTNDNYMIHPSCMDKYDFEKSMQKILDAKNLCEHLLLHKNDLIEQG